MFFIFSILNNIFIIYSLVFFSFISPNFFFSYTSLHFSKNSKLASSTYFSIPLSIKLIINFISCSILILNFFFRALNISVKEYLFLASINIFPQIFTKFVFSMNAGKFKVKNDSTSLG